ncbi:SDR family NAD(P)-dependent oxidoreductase [Streptomyces sp. NPDC001100]
MLTTNRPVALVTGASSGIGKDTAPALVAAGFNVVATSRIASAPGFLPQPYMAAYAASKQAIEGCTESLDHEIRDHGVRALIVEPAYTRTGFEAKGRGVTGSSASPAARHPPWPSVAKRSVGGAPTPDPADSNPNPWAARHLRVFRGGDPCLIPTDFFGRTAHPPARARAKRLWRRPTPNRTVHDREAVPGRTEGHSVPVATVAGHRMPTARHEHGLGVVVRRPGSRRRRPASPAFSSRSGPIPGPRRIGLRPEMSQPRRAL